MSKLIAKEYKRFEDIKFVREDGSEYWSARALGPALDYTKWENFLKAPPHRTAARQAMPFPPAACKFFDLLPVSLQNLQLHLTKNSFACRPPYLCGVALK